MKLSSEFQGFLLFRICLIITCCLIKLYINIQNCITNTSRVKYWFKCSTNIPQVLSYLSYNFGNWRENGPLICSLSSLSYTLPWQEVCSAPKQWSPCHRAGQVCFHHHPGSPYTLYTWIENIRFRIPQVYALQGSGPHEEVRHDDTWR